jgi:HAD superfamily hydrolase (TIGR01509 family)
LSCCGKKQKYKIQKDLTAETVTMSIKAVIFDLDGTITRPYFDFDAIREEIGLGRNSGPILEAMEKMTPKQRLQAEKILDSHEQKALDESELNEDAKETLSQLRAAGIHIGILTRNKKDNAFAIAKKHDLTFDAVVGREDGPVKPDSFGVLHLCKQFSVKPKETLLVGDYLFDLLCAKAAGAFAVLLKNHKQANDFINNADFCIENISQVIDIIEKKADI